MVKLCKMRKDQMENLTFLKDCCAEISFHHQQTVILLYKICPKTKGITECIHASIQARLAHECRLLTSTSANTWCWQLLWHERNSQRRKAARQRLHAYQPPQSIKSSHRISCRILVSTILLLFPEVSWPARSLSGSETEQPEQDLTMKHYHTAVNHLHDWEHFCCHEVTETSRDLFLIRADMHSWMQWLPAHCPKWLHIFSPNQSQQWPTQCDIQIVNAEISNDDWAFFSHAFWSIIMPYSFKAPTRISQGKYVRASCSGLFSDQCNSNGTRLQCRAAYHPVSPLMNINQRHILTAAQTTKCTLARQCN